MEIRSCARALNFALFGIAPARPTGHEQQVLDWIAGGRHGSMQWMAENLSLRMDPRELLPGARSVICVADQIGPTSTPGVGDASYTDQQTPLGRVARYAQVDDYHKVLKNRLHRLADQLRSRRPSEQFRVCVDTAPVLEREHAGRAGLGWVGKNTMLIHPFRGSHLLLGEIITTLELPPDEPEPDHCGTCTRCIDACPTRCISPHSIDASRCISYLTIEHRGPINPALHRAMGDWIYGCDVCQDVCPYNAPDRAQTALAAPAEYGQPRARAMDPLAVLSWTEEDRRTAFTRSAMKRAKLNQMKRNALIVLGNTPDLPDHPGLLDRIQQVSEDGSEDPLVRETAAQVLGRTFAPEAAGARIPSPPGCPSHPGCAQLSGKNLVGQTM